LGGNASVAAHCIPVVEAVGQAVRRAGKLTRRTASHHEILTTCLALTLALTFALALTAFLTLALTALLVFGIVLTPHSLVV
jgi:hypothetical protein